MNSYVKFIVIHVNILFIVIGLFLMAVAIYLLVGNFGRLDPGFFLGTGLILMFAGSSLACGACLGCQGVNNQGETFGPFWTGRKILLIYQVLITILLVGELWACSAALRAAGEYAEVYPLLNKGETHDYVMWEDILSAKFNKIFFAAATTCEVTVYTKFWSLVSTYCPTEMQQLQCEGCYDYSLTFCSCDENACYEQSGSVGDGAACPYTQCRAGVLEYVVKRVEPVSYGIFAVCVFQAIQAFLNLMIMCYTPRDNLETILIKSGTLTTAKNNV